VVLGALAAVGGVVVESRLSAARRTRAGVELGAASREMESWMRMQRLLPAHDLVPAYEGVRSRMRAIDERYRQLGAVADGPAHYALGRGHMELSEYDAARADLEAAWRAGYRAPEVAYALGRTLSALYEDARYDLSSVGGEAHAAGQRESERRLRDPAIVYLRAARDGGVESPGLVEALIAYDEYRWEEAARLAHQAAVQSPWLFEASRVEGDAWYMQAVTHEYTAGIPATQPLDDAAAAAYQRALAIGRSDEESHRADCRRRVARECSRLDYGQFSKEALDGAVEACRRATTVNPRRTDARAQEALLYVYMARYLTEHGQPPDEFLRRAEPIVTALVRDHDDWQAQQMRGKYFSERALYDERRGADPRTAMREAVSAYQRSVDLHPYLYNFNDLGGALYELGGFCQERGEDPRPHYQRAIAVLRRGDALPLDVDEPSYLGTLTGAYVALAQYEVDHGGDPGETLREAIATGQRAVKALARPTIYSNLAAAIGLRGEYEQLMGRDPTAFYDQAEAILRQAGAEAVWVRANLADIARDRALYLLETGRDATATLDAGRAALAGQSGYFVGVTALIRLEGLAAVQAARRGASPAARLAAGHRAFARALPSGAQDPLLWLAGAELSRREAELAPRSHAIADGLRAARRALALDAQLAEAHAVAGELLLLLRSQREADEEFAEAVRLNGNLRRRLSAPWAEARRRRD
jgi:serine/threonine-protein kinase